MFLLPRVVKVVNVCFQHQNLTEILSQYISASINLQMSIYLHFLLILRQGFHLGTCAHHCEGCSGGHLKNKMIPLIISRRLTLELFVCMKEKLDPYQQTGFSVFLPATA